MKFDDVKLWHIYHMERCRHTKPKPKPKFVVTAGIEGDQFLVFLINTEIKPFILYNYSLLACETTIKVKQHPFLNYDSFVDCREAYLSSAGEFSSKGHRGRVSREATKAILAAVEACEVLKIKHQKTIIQSANNYLNTF